MRRTSLNHLACLACLLVGATSGCGDGAAEAVDLASAPRPEGRDAATLGSGSPPTVAILQAAGAPGDREPPPAKGSPEWLLQEIAAVRAQPVPETDKLERVSDNIRRRNRRIVALAEEAIAKTHSRADLEAPFNAAVHHLLEARMQLALQNDRESIAALYDDAAAIHERAPQSQAAVLAGSKLVEFAREMARRQSASEPRWLAEFARQARLFAANHPQETLRAAELLDAAGWSCEAHGLIDEALGCYQLLQNAFAETPQAEQAVAIMRRLELKDRPLRLAGPTFDGGYVDLERDYAGKVVLVVFWDTRSRESLELLPALVAAHRKYGSRGLEIIGVSLDEDERAVEAAVEQGTFAWPTIFHAHRKLRRWNSPIARFYGVREIPMLWLVNRQGHVVNTHVDPAQLEALLEPLCASN